MKKMKLKNTKFIYLIFLVQFYFLGFFFRENIAGGAEKDFSNITWPAILSFKKDFFFTLKNYGTFGEGSLPLFHILNAYLNPFIFSEFLFQGSITVLSFFNVIVFSNILKNKFNLSKINSLLYGSVFLILPFFRSSAFWGLTENLGWLFLLISIKIYLDLTDFKNKQLSIFLLTFFSSLALYTRPYLIFLPIFLVLKSILEKNYFFLKRLIIFYFILAIPGFYLIYLWGGSVFIGHGEDKINLITEYHNPKFVLKNLVIFASIFLFYIFPLELIIFLKGKKFPEKKNILTFLIFFIILLILDYFKIFNYLYEIKLGGGALLKLVNSLFDNKIVFFLFLSSIGFTLIFKYFIISKSNKILFFSLLIFCFPKYIFQEYFEPLMIILFFSIFDFKDTFFQLKNNKSIIIFISYFSIYFIGSFFFRYYH